MRLYSTRLSIIGLLIVCLCTGFGYYTNAYADCVQGSSGGQCVQYVRSCFGGSYQSMPGLCQYNPDCGAYNAWGIWDLGFGGDNYPFNNSIMILNQSPGLPTGHMAVVETAIYNSDGTYTLTVHESNWGLDELVDCDVEYTFYPTQSEVTRGTATTKYPVLGFIYGQLPLRISNPFLFRSNVGPNSLGWGWAGCDPVVDTVCDSLGFGCFVDPVTSTTVVAENLDTGYFRPLRYIGGVNPYEFARRTTYDPNKTGIWVITATNGPNTATTTIPAIGDVEQIPFLRNVQLIGSGLSPTISWTVPPNTGADRVIIDVIDAINVVKLWRSPVIGLETTEYTIPEGVLQADYPFVIRARLQDTISGTIYGPDKSRSESFFDFTPLEEGEPQAVYLPTVGQDPDPTDEFGASYTFDIDVEQGVPCFIDPFVAIGYDYTIGAEDTVKFASVTLPEVGDNLFDLYLFNGTDFYLAMKNLGSGVTYNFGSEGVDKFRILGIEEEAELDPLDVTAFITEVTFTGTGKYTGSMTPITDYPCTVDFDPDTLELKSKGKYVTCYIELPESYDPKLIDIGSVTLSINGTFIPPKLSPTEIGDYDSDSIPDLMIKFDRLAVQEASTLGEMEIKISGSMVEYQECFQGTDTVFVID